MSLRDRLLDLDARFGIPRDADEAWDLNVRYWWIGISFSVVFVVAVLALGFVGDGTNGAVLVPMIPFLAFSSGYFYAHRLRQLGRRSAWFDRPTGDTNVSSGMGPGPLLMVVLGAAVLIGAVMLAVVVSSSEDQPPPLTFACMQPPQEPVERLLDVSVAGSFGRSGDVEQLAEWTAADKEVLVRVVCTSLAPQEVARVRGSVPDISDAPSSDLRVVLADAQGSGFEKEIRFLYEGALVSMSLAREIDRESARELVGAWRGSVELMEQFHQ